jgi:hypothetical protein
MAGLLLFLLVDVFVVLAGESADGCLRKTTFDLKVHVDKNGDVCTWDATSMVKSRRWMRYDSGDGNFEDKAGVWKHLFAMNQASRELNDLCQLTTITITQVDFRMLPENTLSQAHA